MGNKSAVNWEKKLNIRTGAADYEKDDAHHSRYEPTAYPVLERLAASGCIRREDVLIDYGSGKGRAGFFLNYVLGCGAIGVEYNPALVECAGENLRSYAGGEKGKVSFVCASAENYEITDACCFYFFNPFSEKILRSVLRRILESYYANPREMRLFFYYALDSYIDCLMDMDQLQFAGEIDCRDLFHNDDPREKILIYNIP